MATYVTGRMVEDQSIDTNDLQQGVAIPPGAVMSFAMSAAPVGWLPCDGAAISRTTYSGLFNAVRTIHGAGNGSTTFNVPDLRGEFIRGWSAGKNVGDQSTRVFGSVETDQFKSHTHNVNNQSGSGSSWIAFSREDISPSAPSDGTGYLGGGQGNDRIFYIESTGSTETRPRNIALLYCIKF